MREPLCRAVALREVTKRVEWGSGERRVRVQVEVRMCICVCFRRGEVSWGLAKGGGDTYGSVVDEAGRWGAVVWGIWVVVVVVVVVSVVWVLRWTEFRGWDFDVKRGKGFTETGHRGDRAGVGFES